MDERYDLILNMKNVRKIAFAVGLGFSMGKAAGRAVSAVYEGAGIAVLQRFAKNGNQIAQDICKKNNLTWDDNKYKKNETMNKSSIGFHV